MRLTVIVPVFNGLRVLPGCMDALSRSTLAEDRWNLLVVDDASTDGTGAWAEARGLRVRYVSPGPTGPAAARNAGAESARGDILVFVDADVEVAPDALSRFARRFEEEPRLGAVFGAYDDRPGQDDFLSQYRNLYHRWVHLRGAGPAETFWAGCGAVRREAFEACGGFDAERYPRPQIEDIELGYRLRDAGWTILLDPEIECRHMKRWTLPGIVRTDLFDRGVPWMRLLLERPRSTSLNVGRSEQFRTAVVGLALAALIAAAVLRSSLLLALALAALAAVVVSNAPLYRWFARRRGWAFAVGVVGMNLLFYAVSGVAALLGIGAHLVGRRGGTTR